VETEATAAIPDYSQPDNQQTVRPLGCAGRTHLTMTMQALPTAPNRDALRALFDGAVKEIDQSRQNANLTAGFYAKTGNAVSRQAGYLALSDYCIGAKAPQRFGNAIVVGVSHRFKILKTGKNRQNSA
jgi:hypothetical protein